MGGGGDQKVLKKIYLRRAIFNRYDPPCIGREFASQLAWRALTIVARSLVELDVVMI